MNIQCITPILNISDFNQTTYWFEKLGWVKKWDWGAPPTFGCIASGNSEIFICLNGQGGRGKGKNTGTFNEKNGETADQGVWLSIWTDNVDEIYTLCLEHKIEVLHAPENMPWNVRELHIRHPDGHVFRISQDLPC